MHTIYRIVCFQNGKVYVGKTNNTRVRFANHRSTLKHGVHGSKKLQNAWNKYGESSFYFEILERNIPADKIDERENHWIKEFDSYKNGFNHSWGGEGNPGHGVSVVWDGVEYLSLTEAAKALGVTLQCFHWWIKKGYTTTEETAPKGSPNKRKCTWNNVEYKSLSEAARALGIHTVTMLNRLQAGYTCDDDMVGTAKPCVWNGVEYPSITEAARVNGVEVSVMKHRIKKGHTCEQDVIEKTTAPLKCTWNGIEYSSINQAAKAANVNKRTMKDWLLKGFTQDSEVKNMIHRPCEWNGIHYKAIGKAARAIGVSDSTMKYRLAKGYKSDADLL